MTIGHWIRERREALGWSQDELAFRCHVSPRLIGRYERGEGQPNITNLVKIASALGVPLPWGDEGTSSDRTTGRKAGRSGLPMLDEPQDLAFA